MKIAILSQNEMLYSTRRLKEAAIKRGHLVDVIHPLDCYISILSGKTMVHYQERELSDYDAIIPRIGASITFYGSAILRQFEMMGVYCLNDTEAIARARDKLKSMQILSQKGIGLPATAFAHSVDKTSALIKQAGGVPVIIKLLQGTQGKGVVLAETYKAAESVIDAFREMDAYFLVQEFVKEAGGTDIRCFVIGDKVVASMLRRSKEGEFRSNLHRGGKAEKVKITPEERSVAVRAAKAMKLKIAGVDLLRSNKGPLVMEVNASPGLEGLEKATLKDVATMIIEFIEENYQISADKKKKKVDETSRQITKLALP